MTDLMMLAETPQTAAQNTKDVPDNVLISEAKKHNGAMERHLRKSTESFWKLGETLSLLFQRRHLSAEGRWASVLSDIGISTGTDSQARRLYRSCTLADVSSYKNRTAALRAFGILAAEKSKPEKQPAEEHADNSIMEIGSTEATPPKISAVIDQARKDQAVLEPAAESTESEEVLPEEDKTLVTLAQVATLLEGLENDVLTDDHLAQLDRIVSAASRLKGVAHAAA